MQVEIVKPYGYCRGVVNAIELAKSIRLQYPNEEVYILGMLVHNEEVINMLNLANIKTLHDKNKSLSAILSEVKSGIVIFTAHGHDYRLEKQALELGLKYFDATCHFVKNNHELILQALKNKHQVIFIGKANHPETVACLAYDENVLLYDVDEGLDFNSLNDKSPIVLTQTTLSILELKDIYDDIKNHINNAFFAHEVCNATRIRQDALLKIAESVDLIYIIGSTLSSNTAKLFEIACKTYKSKSVLQIKTLNEINKRDLKDKHHIALVSGASTPKETVDEIYKYLVSLN